MSDPAQSGATVAGGGRATRKPQRRESFAGRGAFLIAAIGSAAVSYTHLTLPTILRV